MSCPSATFCVALGSDRGTGVWGLTLNGGTWSSPEGLGDGGPTTVSCATASACVAVVGGVAYTFDGSTWTGRPFPGGGDPVYGLSCPTTSFCVAVGGSSVYTESTGAWSSGRRVGSDLTAVSCPTVSFCVAVGGGSAYVYSNGTWS